MPGVRRSEVTRHEKLHLKALFIDDFVKRFLKIRRRKKFPHREVECFIKWLFTNSNRIGRGAHKTVLKVYSDSEKRLLVLKVGDKKAIKSDLKTYNRIPVKIRNIYFAKIYDNNTEYCLFQKYGKKGRISDERRKKLRQMGKKYRIWDHIRNDNVRIIDGKPKIVDANLR